MKLYFGNESFNRDDVEASQEFTLVELMVVISLVGIAAGMFLPFLQKLRDKNKEKDKVTTDLKNSGLKSSNFSKKIDKSKKGMSQNSTSSNTHYIPTPSFLLDKETTYEIMDTTTKLVKCNYDIVVSRNISRINDLKRILVSDLKLDLDKSIKEKKYDLPWLMAEEGKSGWSVGDMVKFVQTDFYKWSQELVMYSSKVDAVIKSVTHERYNKAADKNEANKTAAIINVAIHVGQIGVKAIVKQHDSSIEILKKIK